ncbi:fatty acyl-AMP ligase [Amycolatopsis samaneae]|uniref:Fatty acyl-AMP ligase n=1 Tax=Amycolatopsis samaneae TaxID=664691 RepID=A0ABW5GWH6_9PSEU
MPTRLSHGYLVDGEQEAGLSYAELDRAARAVAVELRRHVSPGDRALLHYPPGLEFLVGFFGCAYAGVVAVPIAPVDARGGEAAARARAVARSATPKLLLSSAGFLASNTAVLREVLGDAGPARLATDTVDPALAAGWRDPGVEADTVAYLQYSSGSTGEPKGVVLTHAQVLHNLAVMEDLVTLRLSTDVVSWLPMFHDMGLLSGGILPIFAGCPAMILSPVGFIRRPYRWLEALGRGEKVVSVCPNFALDLCVRRTTEAQRARLDLSRLHTVVIGAEPVRAATLDRFAAAFEPHGLRRDALRPCYGLAEATLLVSGGPGHFEPRVHTVDAEALARGEVLAPGGSGETRTLVGCGGVNDRVRVAIVEPGTSRPCPPGRVGEIMVGGRSVGSGYWDNPRATAETFGQAVDGAGADFLRTGDLGLLLDGQLVVAGRRKDLILVDGANHYPTDLESTVEEADAEIRAGHCAVVSVDDGERELVVVLAEVSARVSRGPDGAARRPGIRAAVRREISARHGVAVHDVVLLPPGSLPFTSSGKLQRAACRAGYLDGHFESLRVDATTAVVS